MVTPEHDLCTHRRLDCVKPSAQSDTEKRHVGRHRSEVDVKSTGEAGFTSYLHSQQSFTQQKQQSFSQVMLLQFTYTSAREQSCTEGKVANDTRKTKLFSFVAHTERLTD
jgi:hypothetical protein